MSDDITVERNVSPAKLDVMGVDAWPIWEKEVSTFDWTYDRKETCYLQAGRVTVTPAGGEPVSFGRGDLVIFSPGLSCVWQIHEPVRKHYLLED